MQNAQIEDFPETLRLEMGFDEEERKLLKVLAGIYADMILKHYDDQLILETHPEGYHPEKENPASSAALKEAANRFSLMNTVINACPARAH